MEWTGEMIRNGRLQKGWTQTFLGKVLGYSAMAVSHFERGTRPVPPRASQLLGVHLDPTAATPRHQTVHSPNAKAREHNYLELVREFQEAGFTPKQTTFLIKKIDEVITFY